MDLKIMLSVFGLIFLAEIGDKTQMATLAFATGSESRLSVFIGASLALVVTSALAVFAGEAFSRAIPVKFMHVTAGVGFIAIGAVLLLKEFWN